MIGSRMKTVLASTPVLAGTREAAAVASPIIRSSRARASASPSAPSSSAPKSSRPSVPTEPRPVPPKRSSAIVAAHSGQSPEAPLFLEPSTVACGE